MSTLPSGNQKRFWLDFRADRMAAHRKSDRYRNDLIAAISAFLSGESRHQNLLSPETSFRRLRRRRWTITVLLGLRNRLPPHARDSDPFRALLGWANLKPSILFFGFINVGKSSLTIFTKPVGAWAGSQLWIVKGEQSGSLTLMATEGVSSSGPKKY